MLTELLALLPILAVASAVAYGLLTRTIKFQGREARQVAVATTERDIVRRFQDDVSRAQRAEMQSAPAGDVLHLEMADRAVILYAPAAGRVARTEQLPDGQTRAWDWDTSGSTVRFQIERLNAGEVVWFILARELPAQRGPDFNHALAVAARVGRGGCR